MPNDTQAEFSQTSRVVLDNQWRDSAPASKALRDAIIVSRKHIESAFLKGMSSKKLSEIKVKVKAPS